MSWGSHTDRIKGNANKSFGFIKRNIKTRVPRVREMAYNALVRPQLEYAAPVWDPHTNDKITKIEKLQRRADRWTCNNFDRYASVSEMVNNLGWRSLEQRRADARLCLFYNRPVCSKQTGLGLWFWFQIGFTVSNKCIVCYNHGHHDNCSNQTLLRMIWSGKHQCVILENIKKKKQQWFVKNNHFSAMNFMTKFCCRHILFLSDDIFGHTKSNKPVGLINRF